MTAIDIETTVGDLVVQRPGRSRLFQQLGIDFCCGGKKTLAQACRGKGLDPQSVLQVLLASEASQAAGGVGDVAGGQVDAASLTLSELCDHIEQTHHAHLKTELPRLHAMIHKVAAVHGDRHAWMRDVLEVYVPFMDDMIRHMNEEEQQVFPLIRRLEAGGDDAITGAIVELEHEHEAAGQALERMRELTGGFTPPPAACNTFRATLDGLAELEADMHQHVHKENNALFPRVLEQSRAAATA